MIHMLIFNVAKIALTFGAKIKALGLSAPVSVPIKLWTLGHPLLDFGMIATYVAIVLVFARLTYEWIEAPARNWFAERAIAYERGGEAAVEQLRSLAR